MFLVPYTLRPLKNGIIQVWLFLERNGTHLIETTAADAAAFLKENELTDDPQIVQEGNILFAAIPENESLSRFYSWSEVQPGTIPTKELWRPFLWTTVNEGVNHLLSEVQLSGNHTAFSVLSHLKPSC